MNDEEGGTGSSQGGQLFKDLLARAAAKTTTTGGMPVAADAASNLSVEEQARLFREMMQNQQKQQPPPVFYPPVAPAPLYPSSSFPPMQQGSAASQKPAVGIPRGNNVAADGRRIGRNRDADAINNSADVYFAQLKRDSTIRNYARYSGDDDKANVPFGDPSISEIKLHVNPYLTEMRQKEKEMMETSMDEMIKPEYYAPKPIKPENYRP